MSLETAGSLLADTPRGVGGDHASPSPLASPLRRSDAPTLRRSARTTRQRDRTTSAGSDASVRDIRQILDQRPSTSAVLLANHGLLAFGPEPLATRRAR